MDYINRTNCLVCKSCVECDGLAGATGWWRTFWDAIDFVLANTACAKLQQSPLRLGVNDGRRGISEAQLDRPSYVDHSMLARFA